MKNFMLSFFVVGSSMLYNQAFSQPYEMAQTRPTPDFFIPASELAPRFEKLPPIATPNNYPTPYSTYSASPAPNTSGKVSRYIAVDGRYIPVYEEDPEADLTAVATQITTDFDDMEETAPITTVEEQPVQISPAPKIPETLPAPTLIIREAAVISPAKPASQNTQNTQNSQAPKYRNRYDQYLETLQIFQKNKQMPDNPELERTLAKLNSSHEIILFNGTVKPK